MSGNCNYLPSHDRCGRDMGSDRGGDLDGHKKKKPN